MWKKNTNLLLHCQQKTNSVYGSVEFLIIYFSAANNEEISLGNAIFLTNHSNGFVNFSEIFIEFVFGWPFGRFYGFLLGKYRLLWSDNRSGKLVMDSTDGWRKLRFMIFDKGMRGSNAFPFYCLWTATKSSFPLFQRFWRNNCLKTIASWHNLGGRELRKP